MRAHATLAVHEGACRWRDAPPVVLRRTGAARFHLVQTAGGPIGGDDLGLDVVLDDGCEVELRSVAATIVQPGHGTVPARWRMLVELGHGARLRWAQLAVVCERAYYETELSVRLRDRAQAIVREEIVLGRADESGGRYCGRLAVNMGSAPLLRHDSLLDGADDDLCGPAGTGGHRALGTMVVAGDDVRLPDELAYREPGLVWSVSPLAGPGFLVVVLSTSSSAVSRTLDEAERSFVAQD
ncbi:MAG: urease accessory protein UreD [Sciscionella sp.]